MTASFLDYSVNDNLFNTDIITWGGEYGGRPRNIVYARNEALREERLALLDKRPNQLTALAYARDIDGDGRIEAAGNQLFPGYNHNSIGDSERAYAAIWYAVTDDDALQQRYYTYLSINDDYVFFFPDFWQETTTVTVDNQTGEVIFLEYDSQSHNSINDVENQLLSIITLPKGERLEGLGLSRSEILEYTPYKPNDERQFDYYVKVVDESLTWWQLDRALRIF